MTMSIAKMAEPLDRSRYRLSGPNQKAVLLDGVHNLANVMDWLICAVAMLAVATSTLATS